MSSPTLFYSTIELYNPYIGAFVRLLIAWSSIPLKSTVFVYFLAWSCWVACTWRRPRAGLIALSFERWTPHSSCQLVWMSLRYCWWRSWFKWSLVLIVASISLESPLLNDLQVFGPHRDWLLACKDGASSVVISDVYYFVGLASGTSL